MYIFTLLSRKLDRLVVSKNKEEFCISIFLLNIGVSSIIKIRNISIFVSNVVHLNKSQCLLFNQCVCQYFSLIVHKDAIWLLPNISVSFLAFSKFVRLNTIFFSIIKVDNIRICTLWSCSIDPLIDNYKKRKFRNHPERPFTQTKTSVFYRITHVKEKPNFHESAFVSSFVLFFFHQQLVFVMDSF